MGYTMRQPKRFLVTLGVCPRQATNLTGGHHFTPTETQTPARSDAP